MRRRGVVVAHRAAATLVAALITACMPAVVPIQQQAPAEAPHPQGPQLAVDVTNMSAQPLDIAYEFEGDNSAGGGEGPVLPCNQSVMPFAMIAGEYVLTLEGASILEGTVPPRLPPEAWLLVRVVIGADGELDVIGPVSLPRAPEFESRSLGACG